MLHAKPSESRAPPAGQSVTIESGVRGRTHVARELNIAFIESLGILASVCSAAAAL